MGDQSAHEARIQAEQHQITKSWMKLVLTLHNQ